MDKNIFNIQFLVNDTYLAKFCIRDYQNQRLNKKVLGKYDKKLITDFQKTAKLLSEKFYNELCKNWNADKHNTEVSKYLEELTNTENFKKIKNQTEQTIPLLENEWKLNLNITSEYINSLGIKIKGDFTVYLNHPIYLEGIYWGNGVIIWSYRDVYPNYNTIYLWHEILHELIGKSDREHALIELITDNQMRKILNGTEYPPFSGHKDKYSGDLRIELNPKFQEYLSKREGDVISII